MAASQEIIRIAKDGVVIYPLLDSSLHDGINRTLDQKNKHHDGITDATATTGSVAFFTASRRHLGCNRDNGLRGCCVPFVPCSGGRRAKFTKPGQDIVCCWWRQGLGGGGD